MNPIAPSARRPAVSAKRRPRRYVIAWLVGAWIALAAAGAVLHDRAWRAGPGDDGFLGADGPVIKPLANIFVIATAPGRPFGGVMRRLGFGDSFVSALAVSGAAWAAWFAAIGVGVWLSGATARLPRSARPRIGAPGAAPHDSRVNLSRRRLLLRAPFAAAGLAGGAGVASATLIEPWRIQVRRYTVPVRGLPASLAGLRIAQISDTHLGPRISAAHVRAAVRVALDLRPDVFALTGDYLWRDPDSIDSAAALFAPLTECVQRGSAIAALGVLGNHDWYASGARMKAALERVGVRMIDNSRMFLHAHRGLIADGASGECVCLAGLGDLWEDVIDVKAALGAVDPHMPRVVLAHNPDTAEREEFRDRPALGAPVRIDLMLSGHTHGGQVRLPVLGTPVIPSDYGQKYAGGLVQGPAFPVVVSRGVGMSILPVRFGVPPEVVEVTLIPA